MARKKRPTLQDMLNEQQKQRDQMEQQREQLRRLAIEDIDVRFQNHLRNRTPDTPRQRDGPKKN